MPHHTEPKQPRPFLQLAAMAAGLYLLITGASAWIASYYVSHGILDMSWYVKTIGTMATGALVTFGPMLKTILSDAAMQILPRIFPVVPVGPTPGPSPTPAPGPGPVVPPGPGPQPVQPNLLETLLSNLGLPSIMLSSPEASFMALLALARYAKLHKNKALLDSLKQTGTQLFETCFTLEEPVNAITAVPSTVASNPTVTL